MVPEVVRVRSRRRELGDAVTLELEREETDGVVPVPGQFAMLWPFGVGEAAISYSGIGPHGSVRHTVRSVGPISDALCRLQEGDTVGSRGPFGVGWELDRRNDRPTVVVAGGLGLAPLRPAIERLNARGALAMVLVGARDPGQVLYAEDLERWAANGLDVRVTVDHARSGWRGHVGLVTELFEGIELGPHTRALVCGPETMMRFAATRLLDAGLPADSIQVSLERNMQCGIGHCGHCQLGGRFVCTDGPVFVWSEVDELLSVADR